MKYEISQGQYTEFLNTFTRTQQQARVASDISTDVIANIFVMTNTSAVQNRNVIVCPASGNGTTAPIDFSCTRPDRACNFLSWMDGCAYMDWAGLRPMSELEFEKICRGPLTPVADEFAWGTTNVISATTISGSENGTETITTPNANCNAMTSTLTGGDGGLGPLRCGIFAKISTTREQAGATYYGVMDMSGSVREKCVIVGNSTGRLFDGLHGDGILSTLGNANTSNWPGLISGEITGATGSIHRGDFRISDRSSAVFSQLFLRLSHNGFRGVRTSQVGTLSPNNK